MPADPNRVRDIFLAAVELSPEQRSGFLADACGAHAELRAEVDRLLVANSNPDSILEPASPTTAAAAVGFVAAHPGTVDLPGRTSATDAFDPVAPEPTTIAAGESRPDGATGTLDHTDPDATTAPGAATHAPRAAVVPTGREIGTVIAGRYTLVEEIGEGGMGLVYLASQASPVKRQVALKLIKIGMDSRAVLARFDAERQALAMMDHPNIARIYDGGVTTAGQPFFVMELVRGVPLTECCDAQRLTVQARLELFVAVCQAVQHAHQKGIIHRDLKPGNVLVTEVDGRPTPKVIDFGVAKATELKLTDMSFADTGAIVGTPAYMSPEQADPSSMDIDTRTDVYSLGVILYELLAGSPPIDSFQFRRGAILEMLRMVREDDPPRPSTKLSTADGLPNIAANRSIDPAQLRRAVRGDLDWVVMKALEKDRARRYDTANGFAADILRHLAHEPVLAAPPSRAYRTRKFLRKHRAGVIAASLVLLALLGGIVGTSIGMLQAREAREAETKRAEGEKRAKESETVQRTKAEKAREEAQKQEQIALDKAEQLAREDYVNRVNRAYREMQDDNVALAEDLLHGCDPKRRGWEWNYVERLCNSERRVIDVGNTSVNAIAFSPDGTWAVTGSGAPAWWDGSDVATTLVVWDVKSGQQRKTWTGPKGVVKSVAVSRDGKHVAAGCAPGLVVVRSVGTGEIEWTRSEPGLSAMSVAFSPDGKSLAVGYGRRFYLEVGRVKVWDVASGAELEAFTGPRGGVSAVAFRPGGKRLAVAGSEVVEVWELGTAHKIHELKAHKKWVCCLAYSPDGRWLATGGWDLTVKLRDAATGAETLTVFAQDGFVLSLAFSPDSRTLVTLSEDRSARLWEVPSGRPLAAFHGHTDFVNAVAFRPVGREVCTGSVDGSVRFWDIRTSRPVVVEHSSSVSRVAFRRDGLRVVSEPDHYFSHLTTGWNPHTTGWNPHTGDVDTGLSGTPFLKLPVEFVPGSVYGLPKTKSPDGKLVAQLVSSKPGDGGVVRSKEYSQSSVLIREMASGRVVHTLTGHSGDVVSMAFSPDGRRLATASYDRTLKLWDMETGQDVFTLRGHTAGLTCLAFSPDGNQIVTGSYDTTARVWNGTPLASNLTAEHDARYRKKVEALDLSRAKILAGTGQWGMVAQAFARAAAKDPDNLQLRYQQLDALGKAGNTGAIEAARKGLQTSFEAKLAQDPKDTAAAAALAQLYHLLGDQPALDKLLERHPAATAGIGDRYAADKNWERAIAEYTRAITPETKDSKLLAKRAEAYAKLKRWDLAVADWRRAGEQQPEAMQTAFDEFRKAERWNEAAECGLLLVKQKPDEVILWLWVAPVLVLAEDQAGYAEFCGRMAQQFAQPKFPGEADVVVKAAPLRANSIDLAKLPGDRLAKSLDEGTGPDWFAAWGWSTRALLAYRKGDGESAVKYVMKSEEHEPEDRARPLNLAVLAMAQHRLQHHEESRRALEEASQLIKRLPADDKNKYPYDLLILEILFREAEALINGKLEAKSGGDKAAPRLLAK